MSSKPFAPLNFRINSRNLSGKPHLDFADMCEPSYVFLTISYLSCRHWHNNACGRAFSTEGLRFLDWKASFLLSAYHRPHYSKY